MKSYGRTRQLSPEEIMGEVDVPSTDWVAWVAGALAVMGVLAVILLMAVAWMTTMGALERGPKQCEGQPRQECIAEMRVEG